ncbi:SIMPL domain-containing protein [Zhouia amylolytica]|uniref:Outer membrane protein n=1 Tax=Zhouia amylolytica AD3 TaxID=1286632 RepID=W2UNB2_9FLAO|nr:SIMPL domain-containing protein [Zhouia amylolytica]ETN95439.1 hypothetical protein P278_11610 [Zhouia amylolytica AD3]
MKKAILILVAMTTVGLQAQNNKQINPSVSVTGEGLVKVVPDQVLINVRVEHEGNSASEVKQKNDESVSQVFSFLKKMKIDKKDVRTEYLNLRKNYNYQTKEYRYVANQSVSILLRDLNKYEELSQGLVSSGINRIDGVQFKSSKMEEYMSEARIKAILNAKQKAGEYAGAIDQEIGKATHISETTASVPPRPMFKMMAADTIESGGAEQTIATGELEIKVTVNVAFELN